MLGNRIVRTGVTLMLAVMMAGLPALLVDSSGAGDDGWAQFTDGHVVLHADEECVVDDDGNTDNCYNQGGGGGDDDDGEPSCNFWCWLGRLGGVLSLACRYFPNFFLCGR